ncbi:50S ribosomal protein L4 [Nakamurella aerolata]|uniref:Large ribosomal subunit protein uL4 n=1 Tax=Nakamurella aerolata TaxID=1656892 RepID=A0A849A6B2_9ACTN|nr:50S ribosomal protein L4 [Nakamurella aerolata]
MSTVTVTNPAGKADGSVELPAEIFDVQSNIPLMHQVVVAQLAAARQGTHSAKTRGEVRGGGAKPYRQKGTGRARQGSTRAPQFVGGGTVHGPIPHGYSQRTPKKMKAAALRGALSDRARGGRVHVLSALVDGDAPSTKAALATLGAVEALAASKNILVVVERTDEAGWKSLRNAATVQLISADQLNTYDVLCADDVVFTKAALEEFLSFAKPGKAAAVDGAVESSGAAESASGKGGATAAPRGLVDTAKAPAESADTAEAGSGTDSDKGADTGAAKDFGPDSHAPLADGSEPEGFPIKGNADSMLYHVPGSRFYNSTVAEVWFRSPEAAEAAGFLLPPSQRKKDEESK